MCVDVLITKTNLLIDLLRYLLLLYYLTSQLIDGLVDFAARIQSIRRCCAINQCACSINACLGVALQHCMTCNAAELQTENSPARLVELKLRLGVGYLNAGPLERAEIICIFLKFRIS